MNRNRSVIVGRRVVDFGAFVVVCAKDAFILFRATNFDFTERNFFSTPIGILFFRFRFD